MKSVYYKYVLLFCLDIYYMFFKKYIVWYYKYVFFLLEEIEVILIKYFLKIVCSDIINIVVNVLGYEYMLFNLEEEENFIFEVSIWSIKGCEVFFFFELDSMCLWFRILIMMLVMLLYIVFRRCLVRIVFVFFDRKNICL